MNKDVLFIHGGGDVGYEADLKLVTSLQTELGASYKVHCPKMPSDEALPDFGWPQRIGKEMDTVDGDIILAGHSLGANADLQPTKKACLLRGEFVAHVRWYKSSYYFPDFSVDWHWAK
ncbi:hypothetical protein RT717_16770 [Imperialibacter roseus]|uniref:AB hydrolase-1 domain-containing protein n=1 Tax=Imperialibacter roseus TaxID=1324217 RepID=A0ABZ0IJK7_9BACT|nr:alpha/beta fold hydrolase [Imperialibacter roseus]WOK04736.1 hypothetical protein RT717_16770 [Imperialibacter roseus]